MLEPQTNQQKIDVLINCGQSKKDIYGKTINHKTLNSIHKIKDIIFILKHEICVSFDYCV